MQSPAIPGWGLLFAFVGGPSPILAEGPGRGSPPFMAGALTLVGGPLPILAEGPGRSSPPSLAGVCCLLWWWSLANPGRGPQEVISTERRKKIGSSAA